MSQHRAPDTDEKRYATNYRPRHAAPEDTDELDGGNVLFFEISEELPHGR